MEGLVSIKLPDDSELDGVSALLSPLSTLEFLSSEDAEEPLFVFSEFPLLVTPVFVFEVPEEEDTEAGAEDEVAVSPEVLSEVTTELSPEV